MVLIERRCCAGPGVGCVVVLVVCMYVCSRSMRMVVEYGVCLGWDTNMTYSVKIEEDRVEMEEI